MTETDVANLALAKLGEPFISDIDDTGQKGARLAKLLLTTSRQHLFSLHFWNFAMRVVQLPPQPADTLRVTGTLATLNGAGWTAPITFPILRQYNELNSRAAYRDADNTSAPPSGFSLYNDGTKWILTGKTVGGLLATWNAANGTPVNPVDANWTASAVSPATGVPTLSAVEDPELVGFVKAFRKPTGMMKLMMLKDANGDKVEKFDMRRVNGVPCILTADTASLFVHFVQDVASPDDWAPLFLEALTTLLASKIAKPLTGKASMENRLLAQFLQVDLPNARTMDAHDLNSNENHPLREFLKGSLTFGTRGNFYGENENEA